MQKNITIKENELRNIADLLNNHTENFSKSFISIVNIDKTKMKDILNKKVKFREWFRPFAPACLLEDSNIFFKNVFLGRSKK